MPDSLDSWLRHLETLHPKTVELGLERVQAVKAQLGLAPNFPIITVGGTNGKGSTCAMLESILHAAGYRTGLYTSPHLLRYNERVRINGGEADDAELCEAFAAVEARRGGIPLTYFEFATLAALWLFGRAQVDVAILEVGLGGRLDAVNAFDADCAIVTSIDIDHTDYLGDTRETIGYEKAGIFRSAKPAICGEAHPPTSLLDHAGQIGADLRCIGKDFGYDSIEAAQWRYWESTGRRVVLPHPALRGAYQLGNASGVLAALATLKERLPVTTDEIRRGLLEVTLTGRFQILPGRPQIILDVAHNPHAAAALAANLRNLPPTGKTIAVFAMLRDKDSAGVVRHLRGSVDCWLVAGIDQPRGASAAELADVLAAAEESSKVQTFPNVASAFRQACEMAGEDDRIAAFGSFYTVAEVLGTHPARTSASS
ncbi:MAG: bifunctional tetrahydrofolate synthase/dihydrofolate synthase [Sulfuricella sp.]|nr:bifunctional tetrahydrofolate synthase/dihydrofolate synthase [Sulfuricella sp.]